MNLIGHDGPWREWREALAGERMHHAWLLTGKCGLGKMHFALAAARELVATREVHQPEGDHPDIHILTHLARDEKEARKKAEGKSFELKRNISVGQIRAMQQRLNTRPTLGDRRAIIIDPADDMEKGASNALLKSLEEPPRGTYFLLVAHQPARLLPTIRSRCRTLRFPNVGHDQMAALLRREAPEADRDTLNAAIAAANGSPGAALNFIARNLGPLYAIMLRIARDGDPDFGLRGQLGGAIGALADRARVQAALDLARAVIGGMAQDCPTAQVPTIADAHAQLVTLTAQAPTYNFDPGLLATEIGSLLASATPLRDRSNV